MPRERRQIALTDAEMAVAVERYAEQNPDRFPTGRVTNCVASSDGLDLTIRSRDLARRASHYHVSRADTLRILIFFCLDQRIPMPRKGEKSLYFEDGILHLQITLDTHLCAPATKPMTVAHHPV